jgi:hypothetical protein
MIITVINDIMGKLVYKETYDIKQHQEELNIDVNNLSPAMYVIKVVGNSIVFTSKIERK